MTGAAVLDLAREGIWVMILVAAPMMIAGLVVGVVIALFQALTQIQEQTLSFAIKLIAVFATLMLMARWISGEIYNYTVSVFDLFYKIH